MEAHREALYQKYVEYEDKLARIQSEMRELRSQLNSTALIARLPSDVLSLIFEAYIVGFWHEYADKILTSPKSGKPNGWFPILHVDQHWRQVALSTPRLWTYIVPTSKDFVEFAISHSGRLPLTILLGDLNSLARSGKKDWLQAYGPILRELPRIKVAELPMKWAKLNEILAAENMDQLDAPFLESLELRPRYLFPRDTHPDRTLPDISTLELPRLTTLIVHYDSIIFHSFVRSTLKHLSLSGIHMPLHELLSVLETLPSLEKLQIGDVITADLDPPHPEVLLSPERALRLPRLSSLILHDSGQGLLSTYFLTHLELPSNISISLYASYLPFQPTDVDFMFPTLARKLAVPGSPGSVPFTPRSIEMGYLDSHGHSFLFWPTRQQWPYGERDAPHDDETHPKHQVRFKSPDEESFLWFPSIISPFLQHLDISHVVSLSIHEAILPTTWTDLLSHISALEILRVNFQSAALEFMDVFGNPLPRQPVNDAQDESTPVDEYIFPNLKELGLADIEWREEHAGPHEEDFLPRALNTLQARTERGFGVPQLKILFPINLSDDDARCFDNPRVVGQCVVYRHKENVPSGSAA